MGKGIGIVKYGELNYYYPVKFFLESNVEGDFSEISDVIASSKYAFNIDCFQATNYSVEKDVENTCGKTTKEIDDFVMRDTIWCEICKKQKILEMKVNKKGEYYGSIYKNSQAQIQLSPVLVNLFDNHEEIVIPELILFNNLFGIIRITIPIIKRDIQLFIDGKNEFYNYGKILLIKECFEVSTIADIAKFFAVKLGAEINKKYNRNKQGTFFDSYSFVHFIILDCDARINEKKLNNNIEKDIFFILSAPVPNRDFIDYTDDAKLFCKKQIIDSKVCKTFLKINGGCLTLVNSHVKNMILKELDGEEDILFKFESIAGSLEVDFEFAIVANMLEKTNNIVYLNEKAQENGNVKKVHSNYSLEVMKEYNTNKVYFNNMLQQAYGSVIEQVLAFKEKMPFYHLQKNYEEQIARINEIIEYKKINNERNFNIIISALGVVLVMVFGLPTISETFNIITGQYHKLISIALWILLTMVSFFISWFQGKSR